MRRAQVWSMDYTIGFVLFLLTILAVTGVLSRTVLLQDDFPDVERSANAVSNLLLSDGYPAHWRTDDVLIAGVVTDKRLSERKLSWLDELAQEDYFGTKDALNTRYEWALTLKDRNGSLVSIGTSCAIGSDAVAETKDVVDWNRTTAYYYRAAGSDDLLANMTAVNATVYTDGQLSALLSALDDFELVVMEDAKMSVINDPYDAQKAQLLRRYVERGGILVLYGDPGLDELVNVTVLNESEATGTVAGSFLNLSNKTYENLTGYAINATAETRYRSLAGLADGLDFAATFSVGDGDVYFQGGLSGDVVETGRSLGRHTRGALMDYIATERAECTSVETPVGIKHLVAIRRLVAHKGEIMTMTVYVWRVA